MQKYLFDKEIVANQLSVLINALNSQRQNKKTLLSYLEKFSNAMYDNFNSESTDLLLTLINEAHSVFECIKTNISKTLELKSFLENIYQSDFLNTIDAEKFNTEFNLLLENISKTNSNYLIFMNNYENFISQNLKDDIIEAITQDSNIEPSTTSAELNTLETDITSADALEEVENKQEVESNSEIENNIETIEETKTLQELKNENEISNDNIQLENTQSENLNDSENTLEAEETNIDESYFSTYLQEKVLIINKKSGIAILPYSVSDLDELFLDNPEKYSSIQDIIDKEYTIYLDEYENTSISRYKEAFKLAKDKSNYSFSQAANFAKNLLVENKATTLIIAACKNVDELEYYLECLNSNQLERFTAFKIVEM